MLGGHGSPRFPLDDQPQLIGRSERAEIALLEPTVSRRHATVQCQGDRVVLKDLGSKHGTFVNSRRVTSATLKVGDIVVFGLSLVLRLEVSAQPIPAAEVARSSSARDFVSDDISVTAIRTVTIPPAGRGHPKVAAPEDIGRIQNQMAKVHKLAAAGAACAQQLPELGAKLGAALERLAASVSSHPELEPTVAAVDEVLLGLQRLSHHLSLLPRRRLESTSLAEVVESAVAETSADAAARQIHLLVEVEPELLVLAESHRLAHAVAELIRNAIRQSAANATVQVLASRQASDVLLAVVDGGPGFAAEVLETACDPFVTRSGEWEALGLGLFEARQIVMACGGTLEIESRPGVTAVKMRLPAVW